MALLADVGLHCRVDNARRNGEEVHLALPVQLRRVVLSDMGWRFETNGRSDRAEGGKKAAFSSRRPAQIHKHAVTPNMVL